MYPNSPALDYYIAEMLLVYTEKGYKVYYSDDWLMDHINHTIKRGSHASALEPDAVACAWDEAKEKEKAEYYAIYK